MNIFSTIGNNIVDAFESVDNAFRTFTHKTSPFEARSRYKVSTYFGRSKTVEFFKAVGTLLVYLTVALPAFVAWFSLTRLIGLLLLSAKNAFFSRDLVVAAANGIVIAILMLLSVSLLKDFAGVNIKVSALMKGYFYLGLVTHTLVLNTFVWAFQFLYGMFTAGERVDFSKIKQMELP